MKKGSEIEIDKYQEEIDKNDTRIFRYIKNSDNAEYV